MLMSDVSQGLHGGCEFPDGLKLVELTEVVRSSKRVVSAATKFQLGEKKLLTKCHHDSDGPPLQSFLFAATVGDTELDAYYSQYALETVRALEAVMAQFPGLRLHNRVAIIVPTNVFRVRFGRILDQQLNDSFPDRFRLVSAETASKACIIPGSASPATGKEWLVLDELPQMDGIPLCHR